MTDRFFVSLESNTAKITNMLLPGSEKYGIETVLAISENFANDIQCASIVGELADVINEESITVKRQYNSKFYPQLGKEYLFGEAADEEYDNEQIAFIENNYIVKRVNVLDEDGDKLAQIAACLRQSEKPFSLIEMMQDSDHHFTKKSVSNSFILN